MSIFCNFGGPLGGPPQKFFRLAIARHIFMPPITLFVIRALPAAYSSRSRRSKTFGTASGQFMGVGPDRYITTLGQGVDNFGTVQFQYMHYMPIQPVLLRYKKVDDFGRVFGPFRHIMKSDCKKAPNDICVTDSDMFDHDR